MKKISFLITLLLLSSPIFAQVIISTDNSAPNNSAILDVKSVSKGFLPPRMNRSEIIAISNPVNGLVVYCTDCGLNGTAALSMFRDGAWYTLSADCLNPLSPSEGIHVPSMTQIVWHWNTVSGATDINGLLPMITAVPTNWKRTRQ